MKSSFEDVHFDCGCPDWLERRVSKRREGGGVGFSARMRQNEPSVAARRGRKTRDARLVLKLSPKLIRISNPYLPTLATSSLSRLLMVSFLCIPFS
jgi:hypothetical protein